MNRLVILIILLGIAFYIGYMQGKDDSFWADSIEVIKENEILNDFINEIEEIPKKLK
tara:strand:+ start:351 stop:521 length:171 start_codon:yes stop_codon:yes gene_type:complete